MPRQTSHLVNVIKQPLRSALARFGLEITSLTRGPSQTLARFVQQTQPDLLVDVGANQGQYAMHMRSLGYAGRILSFEPGKEAYRLLARNASRDDLWSVRKLALGDQTESVLLQVSQNLVSSSTLKVGIEHLEAAPSSATDHTEKVSCERFDDALRGEPAARIWLKLDVQGSEDKVLAGAADTLKRVQVVQCELSTAPLYDGQARYLDLMSLLEAGGFRLVEVKPGFRDPASGRLLQFDGVFMRSADDL